LTTSTTFSTSRKGDERIKLIRDEKQNQRPGR
jgi:hypothetical protein